MNSDERESASIEVVIVMFIGAVQIFVQLLQSENKDVREQAVWALGNIAGDSHTCRVKDPFPPSLSESLAQLI